MSDVVGINLNAYEMELLTKLTARAEGMGGLLYWKATPEGGIFVYQRARSPQGLFTIINAYTASHKREGRGKWLFRLPDELYTLQRFIETDERIFAESGLRCFKT